MCVHASERRQRNQALLFDILRVAGNMLDCLVKHAVQPISHRHLNSLRLSLEIQQHETSYQVMLQVQNWVILNVADYRQFLLQIINTQIVDMMTFSIANARFLASFPSF